MLLAQCASCSIPCESDRTCPRDKPYCVSGVCSGEPGFDTPHVFIGVSDSNVIDTQFEARVSVEGCEKVAEVRILQDDRPLPATPSEADALVRSLTADHFQSFWPTLGFSSQPQLTLKGQVRCADGRSGTSSATNVSFLPVQGRVHLGPEGESAVADFFVAQGGKGDDPAVPMRQATATFLGCVGGPDDRALAITGADGQLVRAAAPPMACDAETRFSEPSAEGIRWIVQPGLGAYAIDTNLVAFGAVITKLGPYLAVSPSGSVIVWKDVLLESSLLKLDALPSDAGVWSADFPGTMCADPVIDEARDLVVTGSWQLSPATPEGDITVLKYRLSNGEMINAPHGTVIVRLVNSNTIDTLKTPAVAFSPAGDMLYAGIITVSGDSSIVRACPTTVECLMPKWERRLPGTVTSVLPFAKGTLLAVAGPKRAWFLDSTSGAVLNPDGKPIEPSGALQFCALLPGPERDLYLLASLGGEPCPAKSIPREVVAVDEPENGELYRFGFGSGNSPTSGVFVGVDEGGQVWFRVGQDLVKSNPWLEDGLGHRHSWYRKAREAR
jgi:hypothetical protein